jgi:hypothetical protein
MKKRLHNPNLAKIHRSYTVDEVASLYGVFKGAVRRWIEAGLPVLNDKRPMLILGSDLAAFHRTRRTKNKQTCKPGEIYCVRCRAPKVPAGDMADCIRVNDKIWNLVAICPDCDTLMHQRIGLVKLELIRGKMDIALPQAQRHIVDSEQASVNRDFKQGQ